MRIVIDTNLWVAALLSVPMRERVGRIIADEAVEMLADAELLSELEDVCSRPKFAHLLSPNQVTEFLQILRERLTVIKSASIVEICRDPDDDYLLSICLDGSVDFLLTGDKDLLALQIFENTRIITLTDFEGL